MPRTEALESVALVTKVLAVVKRNSQYRLNCHRIVIALVAIVLAIMLLDWRLAVADDNQQDELIKMVADLISGEDKDFRAVGFESVRSGAKSAEATRHFAALLPKLSPESQIGLLSALADRGDREARPALITLISMTQNEAIREAILRAFGTLGEAADVPVLVKSLSASQRERTASHISLKQLQGTEIANAILAVLPTCSAELQSDLLEILADRRETTTMPVMIQAAVNKDAIVRTAAMRALSKIAGPEQVAGMVCGVLRAETGRERDEAERAIVSACLRNPDVTAQAAPLIQAMQGLAAADAAVIVGTLGRVGGPDSLQIVETWIKDSDAGKQQSGLRALCNWPNASIVPRLLELFQQADLPATRAMLLAALIRVAPLPDERPNQERLALLEKTLLLCQENDDRNRVIERARAIRTIETLRFLLPFLENPVTSEKACGSIVELAHHRDLREPNKLEFDKALDIVLATSKNAESLERAKRYKIGQTWERPKVTSKQ